MAPATYLHAPDSGAPTVSLMLSDWFDEEDPERSVVMDGEFVDGLWDFKTKLRGERRLAVLDDVSLPMRAVLSEWFAGVVTSTEATFLPRNQLKVALESPDAHDRFIAGLVTDHDVLLYRGSLTPLFVDRGWFTATPLSTPDFSRLRLEDYGQTVVLGDYEVGSDAILYEHDLTYRRRARAREVETDRSFGGALRRLRIQKGVSRSDFGRLSEKTIARIERNEIDRPHARTLGVIARRLGVRSEEIGSF